MRASVSPVVCDNSSRVYTSGYCVLAKARSRPSSCSPENVVRDLLCLRFSDMPGSESTSLESDERAENYVHKYVIT